ncbi:hypothetical protein [Thiohalomonas denitrificans]|uniref:hypothetical protein n=1 Tax=Thiohalomonas denitrificans TaxID=415747 RepID=UPI0026E95513|nr:hypothetical protein [Thiohalomonas denitrificans]
MTRENILKSVFGFFGAVLLVVMAAATFSSSGVSLISWPTTVLSLDGWHGLELEKGVRCPVCYSLVFPDKFGMNDDEEMQILIDLPRKKVDNSLIYDLDGPLFADKDVLDHLFHLAVDYDYAPAGDIILMPDKYGMLLGLETSENMIGTHVIPLLHQYTKLEELVRKDGYEELAKQICHWSAGQQNFQNANRLIESVRERNYKRFGDVLAVICKEEKEFMKKHGEEFKE